mmetsp:Transcript_47589/g.78974  ORF Transcript_47589/g.78974 Transcript_47589/m.78974 type:complete len:241 (-) Transcript_47589:120-842(-)
MHFEQRQWTSTTSDINRIASIFDAQIFASVLHLEAALAAIFLRNRLPLRKIAQTACMVWKVMIVGSDAQMMAKLSTSFVAHHNRVHLGKHVRLLEWSLGSSFSFAQNLKLGPFAAIANRRTLRLHRKIFTREFIGFQFIDVVWQFVHFEQRKWTSTTGDINRVSTIFDAQILAFVGQTLHSTFLAIVLQMNLPTRKTSSATILVRLVQVAWFDSQILLKCVVGRPMLHHNLHARVVEHVR